LATITGFPILKLLAYVVVRPVKLVWPSVTVVVAEEAPVTPADGPDTGNPIPVIVPEPLISPAFYKSCIFWTDPKGNAL
jgi:hypothetical protein